jgi:hypothetical protein
VRSTIRRLEAARRTRRKLVASERWCLGVRLASDARSTAARCDIARTRVVSRRMVAGWVCVGAAIWTRERGSRKLRGAVLDRRQLTVLGTWRRRAARSLWLARRHVQLQSEVERRLCWRVCSRWLACAAQAAAVERGVSARRRRVAQRALREVLERWVSRHFIFKRRATRLVAERVRRLAMHMQGVAFAAWLRLLRYQERLSARLKGWERRVALKAMDAWLDLLWYALSLRVRARRCFARGGLRQRLRVFDAWAMATNVCVERRLELMRLHQRNEFRTARAFWELMVEHAGREKRHRAMAGKLEKAAGQIRTMAAAKLLKEHAVSRARRRRVYDRIVLAHRVRVLRQALTLWEGRLESRKRTHEVLSQAMSLL